MQQQDQIRSHDDLDEKQSKQKIQVRIDPKPQQSWCPLCTIPFYQPYFNVEERDIYMRVRCSIFSWKPNFLQCVGKNPDLWGPIWIATTIIFILFTGGNFSHYVISSDRDNFDYEYSYIPVAVILIYCTAFIVPILLGVLLKYCFKSEISIFEMVCLYGYSMAIYIPVLLLCIIPYNESQWFFLIVGLVNSTVFIIVNLWDFIKLKRQNLMIIIPTITINVVLLLTFKFYFFGYIFAQNQ